MALGHDLLDHLKEDGFRCAALLDQEGVGALHLCGAAVEQAALVFAEVELVHHLFDVLAVGADQINGLLPVLLAAALKDVAEGVEQDVVALVAAVGLVAQEHRGPLLIGHGGGAGVGKHINSQKAGRERKFVVMGRLQGALTLLHRDLGEVPGHISQAARRLHRKLVLFAH